MTQTTPIAMERTRVERMLQASRLAAVTGSTINAAINKTPTTRIETATVIAARIVTTRLRNVIGTPATRAPSSSSTSPASAR
jgi:hypothetical protein